MDKREVDIEKFFEMLWSDNVSPDVVSDAYMAIHPDFVWEVTFNLYEIWRKDDNLTVKIMARMLESFFKTMFLYNSPEGIIFTKDLGEGFFNTKSLEM